MQNKSQASATTNLFNLELVKKNSPHSQDTISTKSVFPFVVSDLRPYTPAVYGTCSHVARSTEHTCGSYYCVEQYGY